MDKIKKVLEILETNKIKLEFEEPENFTKTIEEISEFLLNKKLSEIFHSTCDGILYEFDISCKKLISSGVFYPLSTKDFTPYKQVPFHLDVISEIFSFYERNLLDLYDTYGIMYKEQDMSKPVAFYYTVEKEVFFDIAPESWQTMFKYLNLSEKNAEFLSLETDNLYLRYIGFDTKNRVDKLGFHTLYEFFIQRDPVSYYSKYVNFENVVATIKDLAKCDLVSLQYSPLSEKFIGVEISLDISNVKPAAKKLFENSIMTEEQYLNLTEMNIPKSYFNPVIKFRWEDYDQFDIKFYLQRPKDE
jgi:hypothetical protein